MRRVAVVLVAALVAALAAGTLAGCAPESGTVVARTRPGSNKYMITVKAPDGARGATYVDVTTWSRCQVGDRWPECKR